MLTIAKAQNLSFSGGNSHSIILCQNGTVYTMGGNSNGQLGTNSFPTNSNVPIQVLKGSQPTSFNDGTYLGSIRQVDAGSGATSVALSCTGTVYSWGWNDEGQVGDATFVNKTTPVQVITGLQNHSSGFLQNVTMVSGGNKNGYVILSSGELMAWGRNDEGQLGNGTNTDSNAPVYVKINSITNLQNVIQVDGGDNFGVALKSDGTVWTWGYNNNKQLGQDDNTNRNFATQVFLNSSKTIPLIGITKITAGDTHVMALVGDGTLYSWGGNWSCQMGGGADQGLPIKIKTSSGGVDLTNVVTISAGNQHSIVSLSNGTVMTWGGTNNYQGQTGTGSGTCYPTIVPSLINIVDVSDGDLWSFAINSSGNVYAFGENPSGALGVGTSNITEPFPRTIILPCSITIPCPKAILGADVVLCQPSFVTLNSGSTLLGNQYVWKLNNNILLGQTSNSLFVNTIGTYKVIIKNTAIVNGCGGCPADSDEVVVNSITTTSPINPYYCSLPTTLNFCVSGSAGNNYDWYISSTGGSSLNSVPSNCYVTSVVSVPAIYYAQDRNTVNYIVGYTPYSASMLSGYGTEWSLNDPNKMYFDALSSFTLNSIKVDYNPNPPSCGIANAYTLSITGPNNFSIPVTLPCSGGITLIPVGITIPAGIGYVLSWTGLGTNNMKHSTGGANWNLIEQPGIIDFKGPQSYQPNSSSSFFDWNITSGNPCGRIAVQALYDCPLPIKIIELKKNDIIFDDKIKVYPNPSNNDFEILLEENIKLKLYSIDGKLLIDKNLSKGKFLFGKDLNFGIYILVIETDSEIKTIKIIKN